MKVYVKKYVDETEYRGKPTLTFSNGDSDDYPFSLGIHKLATVVSHIDRITEFLKDEADWEKR